MLTKIVAIKNVGRFKDYMAGGDVALRRLNLFFGPNGRGKTTLCEIFRSLQTGAPEIINGRKTLTATENPLVELRSASAGFTFRNGAWNATFADLAIFDTTFVYANVYSGEAVSLDNKRNLYRVIVGEQGVKLAQEVEQLDEQLRTSAKRVSNAKSQIEKIVPKGTTLDGFLKLLPVDDIELRTENVRKEVSTLQKSAEIKTKSLLKEMTVYEMPKELASILGSTIADVSKSATAILSRHVSEHTNAATNDWLATGLKYIKGHHCPFCGLPNEESSLFDAYRTVFSSEFAALRSRIAMAQSQLQSTNADDVGQIMAENHRANLGLAEYWQQFLSVSLPEPVLTEYVAALSATLIAARELVDRKLADPLEPLSIDGTLSVAISRLSKAAVGILAYNEAIKVINASIQKKKIEVDSASLSAKKDELTKLEAVQIRFQKDAVTACEEFKNATPERETLEKKKKDAKTELDQYTETVFGKYQDRINKLLHNFGAGFRIGNTVRNYAGGTPSTNYHIIIDEVAVDIGDGKSPIDQPSFRNTLSAGDRSALAFAFFIARHQIDGDLPKKVLVFDDPFSSQDRSRRICTQQLICKLAEQAAQVIVLSHDHSFLRTVWDGTADKSARKPLQLRRMGKDTIITEWDIEHDTKPNYMQQHAVLKDYVIDGTGQTHQVARTIRPIVEEYLRLTFPNQFAATEWLGDFIKKIREADDLSILKTAQGHLEEIEAINDYSKGFHHAGASNAEEPIDDTELASYSKRVLDFIEGF